MAANGMVRIVGGGIAGLVLLAAGGIGGLALGSSAALRDHEMELGHTGTLERLKASDKRTERVEGDIGDIRTDVDAIRRDIRTLLIRTAPRAKDTGA